MPYIEEELEIQCRGENGSYGMLRKLDNGKYTINVLVVDYSEYDAASRIFENYLPQICRLLGRTLEEKKEEILRFPYLSPQTDIRFILWALISRVFWGLKDDIHVIIKSRYFADIPPTSSRPFTCAAIAFDAGDEAGAPLFDFYGSDGIDASAVGGYRHVFVSNIYGKRLDRHFSCGHNLSHDAQLLLVLKAIGGLPIDRLTEAEKEIAAKCVACGYLRKQENRLEPKMIVIEREHADAFFSLSKRLQEPMQEIKEQIAEKLAGFMKQHIPKHLMSEYPFYIELIAGIRILSNAIEACIQNGLLQEPESRQGAEGMLMIVEK